MCARCRLDLRMLDYERDYWMRAWASAEVNDLSIALGQPKSERMLPVECGRPKSFYVTLSSWLYVNDIERPRL